MTDFIFTISEWEGFSAVELFGDMVVLVGDMVVLVGGYVALPLDNMIEEVKQKEFT